MAKLFLASMLNNVRDLLPEFAGDLHGKSVAYIPTASNIERGHHAMVRTESKLLANYLGMQVNVLDVAVASAAEIAAGLQTADVIYVSGGNTFYLLQELKRTGADRLIIREVNAGKLYFGESAGAAITAPDIEYISLMDSTKKAPNLHDFHALNLVDFYVLPHYLSFPFKQKSQRVFAKYSSRLPLKTINNHGVVMVNDDVVTITEK
ncbi:Type 1 glutamine amidotransferase-like domain-containing protein [Lactobacillus sp. ESL0679]|uniref:Type 1 glutamine amidotransferase-like domain-containing protein n=1 Tax=Lactobacillus sp. ESL0679 TaxID=2983209 RepID=UPI0023F93665|nr:Type 1 glutamine amidotransferase-like domain-containing protein [Lactobacillus sp. ESL0679]MDF7682015.1 Type 1 glutamine amidotransferase-like domain-containing protein [Lactobacillus sp. ESL0679]